MPAQLDIQAAFSNKDSYQKEVKVSASQKATLSCEVSDLKTEVKWFKDGKQLSSSKTVHMESKGKSRLLVLENVEKKDAGEYTCEAGKEKLPFKIQVTGMETVLDCSFWFSASQQSSLGYLKKLLWKYLFCLVILNVIAVDFLCKSANSLN